MPLLRLLGAGPDDEDNNFDFGDESLDKYFLLREADRGAIDELTSGAVRKSIETFVARHGPALDGLTIGSTTISCCPSVGRSNKMSSITPEQVRTLLPDMIGLARTIEKALGTG